VLVGLERLLFAVLVVLIVAVALSIDQVTGNRVDVCRWLHSTHGLCS
jgi:hypothetical protein